MSAGDAVGGPTSGAVDLDLDGASNVLVLSPSMDEQARRSYYERLLPAAPESLDVLTVDYRQTPDKLLDEWRRYAGRQPRRTAIICVDETTRSTAAAQSSSTLPGGGPDTATTVENPSDLTGLGIAVSEYLTAHGNSDTVVIFDSLTVLLQFVELQRAFRFLHVLANRISTAGAVGHFHMDPQAHTDQELATLSSLFDAVAEYDDGTWDVRRR